jgi:hypothetical protein
MRTTRSDRKAIAQGYRALKSIGTGAPKTAPPGSARALSVKHHKESIKFDAKHAADHLKDAADHKRALDRLKGRTK